MNTKPLILIISTLVLYSVNVYSKDININNKSMYSLDSLKENANQAARNKEYKKAAFLFEQLVKKLPNDEELRLKFAYVLFMNKDYNAATKQFDHIARTSKNKKYVEYSIKQLYLIADLSKANIQAMKSGSNQGKIKIVEIDVSPKENYFFKKRAPTIFEDGRFLRWEKEDLPVKVYIPPVPENLNAKNPEKYIDLVKNSMQKWSEKAPKFVSFRFVSTPAEANININWLDSFSDESTWGLASLPQYDQSRQKRVSTINLSIKAQAGTATFTEESVFFSDKELGEIITHETGHALGLGHSFMERGNGDIMSPSYHNTLPGVIIEITPRDLNTLTTLYKLPEGARCKCKEQL